jgi:glutaryl-CoA dehydrogenase (non-decarboxylating)
MRIELTPQQKEDRAGFRAFAAAEIAPHADRWDREERMPAEVVRRVAEAGYLGLAMPAEVGGGGRDLVTFGLLHEEIGKACSSVRSLLTVHGMVAQAVSRWGTPEQRERWLPRLARGETIGAFGLSEPAVGSDAQHVETQAVAAEGGGFVLSGRKRWITFGQIADLYLIFAQLDGKPTAFLVEREAPGFAAEPITGILGTRASMLGELVMEGCRVPAGALLGRPGFGFSHVVSNCLDLGRYSVAWGSVGIAQAALEASLAYAAERKQFGVPIRDHQLVRRLLTDMVAAVKAARLLCLEAGYLKDAGDPRAFGSTFIAKYFASTTAMRAALDAVQIHGANGCGPDYPVARLMRDAKVMEIIEGSNEIQQLTIANFAYHDLE